MTSHRVVCLLSDTSEETFSSWQNVRPLLDGVDEDDEEAERTEEEKKKFEEAIMKFEEKEEGNAGN